MIQITTQDGTATFLAIDGTESDEVTGAKIAELFGDDAELLLMDVKELEDEQLK